MGSPEQKRRDRDRDRRSKSKSPRNQTVQDENTKKDLEAGQEVGVVHPEGKRGRRKVVTEIVEMATIEIELGTAIGIVIENATNTVVHLPNLIQRVAYCRS